MMTKFKSVSAQTPKLMEKNLAKVKGGDATLHHCQTQARDLTLHHCNLPV